jgi:hypothetical protein
MTVCPTLPTSVAFMSIQCSRTPVFECSSTPVLQQYSSTRVLQHSGTPVPQYSGITVRQCSRTRVRLECCSTASTRCQDAVEYRNPCLWWRVGRAEPGGGGGARRLRGSGGGGGGAAGHTSPGHHLQLVGTAQQPAGLQGACTTPRCTSNKGGQHASAVKHCGAYAAQIHVWLGR